MLGKTVQQNADVQGSTIVSAKVPLSSSQKSCVFFKFSKIFLVSLKHSLVYLKELLREGERWRKRSSIPHWLSWPGMGQTETRRQELPTGLTCRLQGGPNTWAFFCFSQATVGSCNGSRATRTAKGTYVGSQHLGSFTFTASAPNLTLHFLAFCVISLSVVSFLCLNGSQLLPLTHCIVLFPSFFPFMILSSVILWHIAL